MEILAPSEARCELLRSQLKAAEMEGLALRADAEVWACSKLRSPFELGGDG